ncbi:hypothetical protein OHA25_00445 [Nonomuraea sp. NBC_00507]|uniref:hypothetical protein n=1 Tax=Nonomuraea sp. NBC_00507 TaxID=2976002 RepID=UPI002E184E97
MRTTRAAFAAAVMIAQAAWAAGTAHAAADPLQPAAACPTSGEVYRIFMAADGSDAADGCTRTTAVASLARVQALLKAAAPGKDVEVRIARGTYRQTSQVSWDHYVPGHAISFLPTGYTPGNGRPADGVPIFDGGGAAGWWFKATLPSGHPGGATMLRFYYLQVQNYANGLQIVGGLTTSGGRRLPATKGANKNIIWGMTFTRLGNKHAPQTAGTAALSLANSKGNRVEASHFKQLENTGSEGKLMHGVYLETHSNGNTVTRNRFELVSGDATRARNDSNGNRLFDNTFRRTGVRGAYEEWFCHPTTGCDRPTSQECASHGNVFYSNDIGAAYDGGTLPDWSLMPPGNRFAGDHPGCTNEGQPRLRTWSNT